MLWKWFKLLAALILGVMIPVVSGGSYLVAQETAADWPVYTNALASGWDNWSWDTTVNLSNASPVYSGTASIAVSYVSAWGGLYLHTNPVNIGAYEMLQFWLHGGNAGG